MINTDLEPAVRYASYSRLAVSYIAVKSSAIQKRFTVISRCQNSFIVRNHPLRAPEVSHR